MLKESMAPPRSNNNNVSFREVRDFLTARPGALADDRTALMRVVDGFCKANDDPSTSENFANGLTDRWEEIIRLLRNPLIDEDDPVLLLTLRAVKILSRKHENRMTFGDNGVAAVCRVLKKGYVNPRVAGEGANVVLNVCYERANVDMVIRAGGVPPLVKALGATDRDLVANAAGAIQSVCFQETGRAAVRETGAISLLVNLLDNPTQKVHTRAVGALHNLSSDAEAIRTIRKQGGIPKLVKLLESTAPGVCGSAAGALQNVSREVASRGEIKDLGAVPLLAELLPGADLQAQVCAAGALLNILGPEMGENVSHPARKGFGKVLSCTIALAAVYDGLFDSEENPPMNGCVLPSQE